MVACKRTHLASHRFVDLNNDVTIHTQNLTLSYEMIHDVEIFDIENNFFQLFCCFITKIYLDMQHSCTKTPSLDFLGCVS